MLIFIVVTISYFDPNYFSRLDTKLIFLFVLTLIKVLKFCGLEEPMDIYLGIICFFLLHWRKTIIFEKVVQSFLFQLLFFYTSRISNFILSYDFTKILAYSFLGFQTYFIIMYPDTINFYIILYVFYTFYHKLNKDLVFSDVYNLNIHNLANLGYRHILTWSQIVEFLSVSVKNIYGFSVINKLDSTYSKVVFPALQKRYVRSKIAKEVINQGDTIIKIVGAGAAYKQSDADLIRAKTERDRLEFDKEKYRDSKPKDPDSPPSNSPDQSSSGGGSLDVSGETGSCSISFEQLSDLKQYFWIQVDHLIEMFAKIFPFFI